jgi:hypothetical protein
MANRIRNHTLFTLSTWLLPIIPSIFIPLYVTDALLYFGTIGIGVVSIASLFHPSQFQYTIEMFKFEPAMGYMWYETIVIFLGTFYTQPSSFWILLLGPGACACHTYKFAQKYIFPYIFIAFVSLALVLPTVASFVNEDNEFFLIGYSTQSIYGTLLSVSFICIWVKVYHLVCRDSYFLIKHLNMKVLGTLWALFGTALVLTWVSSAWVLHLSVVLYFQIPKEKTLCQLKCFKRWKQHFSSHS